MFDRIIKRVIENHSSVSTAEGSTTGRPGINAFLVMAEHVLSHLPMPVTTQLPSMSDEEHVLIKELLTFLNTNIWHNDRLIPLLNGIKIYANIFALILGVV